MHREWPTIDHRLPNVIRRSARALTLVALLALVGLGCSDNPVADAERAAAPTPIPAPAEVGSDGEALTLQVVDGGDRTGLVLTDHRGFAVYGVAGESIDTVVCTAGCLRTWIPVEPRSGGVDAPLADADYSVFRRPDGQDQVAYRGIPVYTWTGDDRVGITGGAGVAGTWFAITETGGLIEP